MRFREYVAECCRQASSGKLKTAKLWSGTIAIVFSAIAYFWSPLGQVMSWLPASLFALILVLAFLFGIVRAPLRIINNKEQLCRRLQDHLDERKRRQRIVDQLAQLHQKCLQLLMRKVDSNDDYILWKREIEEWYEQAQTEIEDSLGFSEMELFRTFDEPVFDLFVQPFSERHKQDLQFFNARYHQLRITIVDLSTRLR
jgi:hypothetical protein